MTPRRSPWSRWLLATAVVLLAASRAPALEEGAVGTDTGDSVSPTEGLDLSADAENQTGAARTSVPLAVPPGRGGLEPKLVLTYSSQRPSGLYGPGWDLTIGRIERSTRMGAPRYDQSDAFVAVLPGGGYELVGLSDGGYGARIDDAHFRATIVGNGWQLHEKNGRTWEFGTTSESRIGPDTNAFGTTFAWHLTKITDLNGNTLSVTYAPADGNGHALALDIAYGGHGSDPAPSNVHFQWSPRTGATVRPNFAGGFRQIPASYLQAISETFGGIPVRSYDLEWSSSPVAGALLLTRVHQHGADGTDLLTATGQPAASAFGYFPSVLPQGSQPDILHAGTTNWDLRVAEPGLIRGVAYYGGPPDSAHTCTMTTLLDMNGDGLPDSVSAPGIGAPSTQWTVYLNQGNGTFGEATPWSSPVRCITYERLDATVDFGHDTRTEQLYATSALSDMNGDGLPDLVQIDKDDDVFVRVFPNTGAGFDGGTDGKGYQWSAPGRNDLEGFRRNVRYYEDVDNVGLGGHVTDAHTQTDLIDLNGDGRADWLTSYDWLTSHQWQVRWNLGKGFSDPQHTGFSEPQPFPAYRQWLRQGAGDHPDRNADADMFDVNGDGLVDYVQAAGNIGGTWKWNVWYGTGRGGNSGGFVGSDGAGTPFQINSPPRPRLRQWNDGKDRYDYDVFDVNGDRLPDFVDATDWTTTNKQWLVYRNLGSGFATTPLAWDAPAPLRKRTNSNTGYSTKSVATSDVLDLDGNGYPDLFEDPGAGSVVQTWLYHPLPYRPDTLSVVTSPLGGQTHFSYAVSTSFNHASAQYIDPALGTATHGLPFPIFVVAFLQRWAVDLGADGWSLSSYLYDGGVWAPDRREFRGFHTVSKTDHYNVVESTTYHQSDALRGRIEKRAVTNQLSVFGMLQLTVNTWSAVAVGQRFVPQLDSSIRYDVTSGTGKDVPWTTGSSRTTTTTYQYDSCGNVSSQSMAGEGAVVTKTADCASEPHNSCTTERVCPSTFCDRPRTSQIADAGNPLNKSFLYDTHGNMTSLKQIGLGNPETLYAYDPTYGHLTSITDPEGHVTSITYDPVRQLFPYETTRDDNGANLVTRTEFDGRFGKLSKKTDANGAVTEYGYDVFGRRTAVAEPGQTLAQPTTRTEYVVGPNGGSGLRIDTSRREPNHPSKYLLASSYSDALGRPLQTQTIREVGGAEKVVVTAGRKYIAGGRVEREYKPFVSGLTDPRTQRVNLVGTPATTITYDDFSRPIQRTTTDGRKTTTSRATAWVTRRCDFNHEAVAGGGAGQCVEDEDDGVGRLHKRRKFFGATSRYFETRDYDGVGRVLTLTHNDVQAGKVAVTHYTYDPLGRRATMVDPDSGTWNYGYDDNGNLTYENDPKTGQHLEASYDGLDRISERRSYDADELGQGTATTVATYTYDSATNGKGHLALVTDESGSTSFGQYDLRGNVLRFTKTITYLGQSPHFTTVSGFDEIGRLASTTYPYPNAAKYETVFFDYSVWGNPNAVRSDHGPYFKALSHDERGRPADAAYGNNVHDLYSYYGASGAYRLQRLRTQKSGVAQLYRDITYADYDPNGNVRLMRDALHAPTSPLSQTEAVTYDDGSRVTHAWQCGGGRYESAFSVDLLDNVETKDQKAYTYATGAPHAPSSVGSDAVGYDLAGDMTSLPGGRVVTYDAQHRVRSVLKDGALRTYVYDYTGRRVVADTPDGTTFFFDGFDVKGGRTMRHIMMGGRLVASSVVNSGLTLLTAADTMTPLYVTRSLWGAMFALGFGAVGFVPLKRRRGYGRFEQRMALLTAGLLMMEIALPLPATGQCPVSTPPAGTIFYHVDHLGTPQLLTDETGAVVEHLLTRPYGASGGSFDTSGGLQTSKTPFRFTGQRADDGSGLMYFGARYYDAALGMFTTLDPARQFSSPYSYGGGNPLGGTDPSGQDFTISVGFGGKDAFGSAEASDDSDEFDPDSALAETSTFTFPIPIEPQVGVVELRTFIQAKSVFGLRGDDRDPGLGYGIDKSRAIFRLDFTTGVGTLEVNFSCDDEGPCDSALPINQPDWLGRGNSVSVAPDDGSITIDYSLENSRVAFPWNLNAIDGSLTVSTTPGGDVNVHGLLDQFPSNEGFQFRPDGVAVDLYYTRETTFVALLPGSTPVEISTQGPSLTQPGPFDRIGSLLISP